jgi:hypothetical protein
MSVERPQRYQELDREVLSAASESDRAWFEEHPQRSHRVRQALPGEWPHVMRLPHDYRLITVVQQMRPGLRLRAAFGIHRELNDDGSEQFAAALFALATEGGEYGEGVSADRLEQELHRQAEVSHAQH